MDPDPLLRLARTLAAGILNTVGRPSQTELKTAINRTYYALFHTLANTTADAVMGRRARANSHPAWAQTARGLDHTIAKNECRRIWSQSLLTPGARQFAQAFITIQALRHEADYYDYSRYTRSEVIRWIDEAQQAIAILNAETAETRKALASGYRWVISHNNPNSLCYWPTDGLIPTASRPRCLTTINFAGSDN